MKRPLALSQAFSTAEERAHTHELATHLLDHGYVLVPQAVPAAIVSSCMKDLATRFEHTPFCEGAFYGGSTKRFGRVLRHSRSAASLVQCRDVIAIVESVLGPWCDTIQLNLTQGIEIHPGACAQFPHRDQDMWMGQKGEMEYLVNVMWPFSEYRPANGSTVIWPGSHKWAADALPNHDDPCIALSLSPGDALLFLGSTLHHGGANASDDIRRGLIVSYSLGWLKSYENQFLAYPPEIASNFDPVLAELIGYRQHRPNLGNFDGKSPFILLGGEVPEYLAATDELRPEQRAMIDAYMPGQAA